MGQANSLWNPFFLFADNQKNPAYSLSVQDILTLRAWNTNALKPFRMLYYK